MFFGAQLAHFDQINFWIQFDLSSCGFFLGNTNSKLQCKSNLDARLISVFSPFGIECFNI